MRYSSRFFLYGPLVGLLILAALAATHWWSVASAWAERLDRANGREIAPGVRMSFSEKRLSGFPFRLDVVLKDLRVEIAEANGPIIWTTKEFAAHALPYGRTQIVLESAGKQTLSWTDARDGAHRFAFLPGTFRASALLDDGKLVRFDSEIVDLDGDEFLTRNAQLHFRLSRDGIDVYLTLEGAHVAGGYAAALGPDIATLKTRGRMDRTDILAPMLAGKEAPSAAFQKWREAGGKIAVHDFLLSKSGQSITFSGALGLDDAHNLRGALTGPKERVLSFSGSRLQLGSSLPGP